MDPAQPFHAVQTRSESPTVRTPSGRGSTARVVIVDDDAPFWERMQAALHARGLRTVRVPSGAQALDLLIRESFDLVVTEWVPGGFALSQRIADGPGIPVIVFTNEASLAAAIQAVRAGVFDFLVKPLDEERLLAAVDRALALRPAPSKIGNRQRAADELFGGSAIVGDSPGIRNVRALIAQVASTAVPVLITGETGTGKGLVARTLHEADRGREGPFVALNCGARSAALLESELFGQAQGAVTDARGSRPGLLVEGSRGTIFLDEIGEMPPAMQAKLLRALQERRVRPVGGRREVAFNARVLSATHRDLDKLVENGEFRRDLLYRIDVVRLPMPPLRRRGNDVLRLAEHFMKRAARRTRRPAKRLSRAAADKLLAYHWPGNVRELENYIERGVALARGDALTVEDLPERLRRCRSLATHPSELRGELPTMEELERRHIMRVLSAVEGNKTRTARILGLDRRTLYRKARRYGLEI